MQRFKNVLLVFDRDRETLRRAVTLAKSNRARLTVVGVLEGLPANAGTPVTGTPRLDVRELVVNEQREQLAKFISRFRGQRIRIDTDVLVGNPSLEVIREVVRNKRDLVIMTAEGRTGLRQRLFGSTSMHLMRKCPCPVWVMKPTQRKRLAKVLAAVDPYSSTEEGRLLNIKILDLATSLAQTDRGELHIVHAWTLFGEDLLRRRSSKRELDEWVRAERRKHEESLDELLQRYSSLGLNHQRHLVKGPARMVIPDVAERVGADLLVMGTLCRTGIAGFFIGNTAEHVLQHVECSVFTVKPDRFITPVK